MRSERKKGCSFLAKFMVMLMVINLMHGMNPAVTMAEENESKYFRNNGLEVQNESGIVLKETASGYDKGKFDVEMLVKGSGNTITKNESLDVVLLIDRSASMEGKKTKNARQAAKTFVSSLLKNKNVSVGLVGFGGKHRIKEGKGPMLNSMSIRRNETELMAGIEACKPYTGFFDWSRSGTFTQAALRKANEMFSNNGHKKAVILITDGEPTYAYGENGGYIGDGSRMTEDIRKNTVKEAKKMKDSNIQIFSVGIGVDDTGKEVLTEIASPNRYYNSNISASDLENILKELHDIIIKYGIENGTLQIKMNDQVDFKNTDDLGKVTITPENNVGTVSEEFKSRVAAIVKNWDSDTKTLTLDGVILGKDEVIKVRYNAELNENYKDGEWHPINETAILLPKGVNEPNNKLEFRIPDVKDIVYTTITINKKWQNDDVPEGVTEVTAEIYNGAVKVDTVVIKKDSQWKAISKELPKYENGDDAVYDVKEVISEGAAYKEVETVKDNRYEFTITNETLHTYSFIVKKVWEYTASKEDVKVQLYSQKGNESPVKVGEPATIKADEGEHTFTKLLQPGNEIKYFVKELNKDGVEVEEGGSVQLNNGTYNVRYEYSNAFAGCTVTNTNSADNNTFEAHVNKEWIGTPTDITFRLMKDNENEPFDTLVLKAADVVDGKVKGTFAKKLPIYNINGSLIYYRVEEAVPDGYSAVGDKSVAITSGNPTASFKNVNLKDDTIKGTLIKKWVGGVPSIPELTFVFENSKLPANSEQKSVLIHGQGAEWKTTFELPKYNADGSEASYTVKENQIDGFTSAFENGKNTVTGDGQTITCVNTQIADNIEITVNKEWADGVPEIAMQSVKVKVSEADNKVDSVEKEITADANGKWSTTFTMPKWKGSDMLSYSVVETEINGEKIEKLPVGNDNVYYHKAFKITLKNAKDISQSGIVTITNSIRESEPDEGDNRVINVVKSWGKTPAEKRKDVKVKLYRLNEENELEEVEGQVLELNKSNDWKGKFIVPRKKAKKTAISAPITEQETKEREEADDTSKQSAENPIQNEETVTPDTQPEVTETGAVVTGQDSGEEIEGLDDAQIASMEESPDVIYYVFETEIGNDTIGNLKLNHNLYNDGYKIGEYTVRISELISDDSDAETGDYGFYILNEAPGENPGEPGGDDPTVDEKVTIKVTKKWSDSTPASYRQAVKVRLFIQNVDIVPITAEPDLTLDAGNGWTGEFKDLDKYWDGDKNKPITYLVYEIGVGADSLDNAYFMSKPDSYKLGNYNVSIAGNGTYDVTVTNDRPYSGGGTGSDPIGPGNDPIPGGGGDTPPASTDDITITDDTTPQGTAPDANNTDNTDDTGIIEDIDDDEVPEGEAEIGDDDEIDIGEDTTPQGSAKLPGTGGTGMEMFGLLGMGLIGLGLVFKKRK